LKSSTSDVFTTIKPVSTKISRYISYYYFHNSENEDYQKRFIFYPNYKHGLTAYKNSKVVLSKNKASVTSTDSNHIEPLYSINKDKAIKVSIEGRFDKIGVVFNPLGINHFIEKPLHDIFPNDIGSLPYFGEAFKQTLKEVFTKNTIKEKVFLLDDFFEKAYNDFHQPILKKAIGNIIKSNGAIKVGELSEKLKVDRRTLLRLFRRHTNMSVEEYRKMVMFRQALNYFHQCKEKVNLTDVALFSMYYDQAHFIKHFKSITKETPTTLLSKISHIGEEDTYWYFKN